MYGSVWAYWLIRGYDRRFSIKATMVGGMNLICLVFVQHLERGVTLVMALILMQNILSTIVWWKSEDVRKDHQFTATSLYMDPEIYPLQLVFLFTAQLLLFSFFVSTLFTTESQFVTEMKDPNKTPSYTFWIASYIVVQMSAMFNRGADSQIGEIWPTSLWHSLVMNSSNLQFAVPQFGGGGFGQPFQVSKMSLMMRQVMGWITKSVLRDGVAYVVPLFLMQSDEPLDFVLNCLAVAFITTIDQVRDKDVQVTFVGKDNYFLES